MFYGIGESLDYFIMKVIYNTDSDSKSYFPEQKFDNGYGIINAVGQAKELLTEVIKQTNN